jgi:hypothetical protein
VLVLVFKAWEGVYEGSLVAQTMGVHEENKIDSLWELMKEIKEIQYGVNEGNKIIMSSTWLCLLEEGN